MASPTQGTTQAPAATNPTDLCFLTREYNAIVDVYGKTFAFLNDLQIEEEDGFFQTVGKVVGFALLAIPALVAVLLHSAYRGIRGCFSKEDDDAISVSDFFADRQRTGEPAASAREEAQKSIVSQETLPPNQDPQVTTAPREAAPLSSQNAPGQTVTWAADGVRTATI